MPLKIFISSVSDELEAERKALEGGIHSLGELYVGMEYFGSDPRSPRTFDDAAILDCDLYVGLFGDRFGSVESGTGKSFTELEYDAARSRPIPTLVYFKGDYSTGAEEPRQAVFKHRVRHEQIGATFQTAHDLEIQFLIDLFAQIRGPLFAKMRPQLGLIPFDALHAVTKGLLSEQIEVVGQDKYIRDIYIPRPAEDRVRDFVDFEERFVSRSLEILEALQVIASEHGFESSTKPALQDGRAAALRSHDSRGLLHAAATLKQVFFFDSVEADFAQIERIYRETAPARARLLSTEFAALLRGRPYVDSSRLAELATILFEGGRKRSAGGEALPEEDRAVRSAFPSVLVGERIILANDLLKEFDRLVETSSKRCVALVDKAGRGKTNVICRISERTLENHALILLSGQMEISTEYHIEWHVQRRIEMAFGGAFVDWITRSEPALEQVRRWLFVVVDGINESANLPLFVRLLHNLLPKLAGKRIKLILSCRDIYWDLFFPTLKPYLFGEAVPLGDFSETEWRQAMELYFERFQISAQVEDPAAQSLRNPLLLRFFCEAYQRRNLGRISDIHLVSIFNLYIERVGRSIGERLGLLSPDTVLGLLLKVVDCMWQERTPAIEQSRLRLTAEETASSTSIYNLVRAENVILDESRYLQSTRKIVRFVYDEFMEYMLARSWLDGIVAATEGQPAIDVLLQQAMDAVIDFPAAMGAILFLDQMLERGGGLVNRLIALSGSVADVLIHTRQATLLYALENLNTSSVDDELLTLVDRFETVAAAELRPRLAQVVLRLLAKNRDRAALRPVVERILEVSSGQEHQAPKSVPPADAKEEGLLLLPPARHHYSDETKLNAIGLLIGSHTLRDYELVERSIRGLGRMDLHSALHALESVDLADDDFVFKTIAGHMSAVLPEYRIYCAWLLRERYGLKPAEFLLQLLSTETRVHRYAFSLFETRQIEKELLEGILREMRAFEQIKPWLLVYRIKLLGMRASFMPSALSQTLGSAVAQALKTVMKHRVSLIRLATYRALAGYPEFVDREAVVASVREDPEPNIRVLADKIY